jgi:hypothetical protein
MVSKKSGLVEALADLGEVLFPGSGKLPYDAHQLTVDRAAKVLDAAARSSGGVFTPPERPVLVLVDRGGAREPIVMLHGYEFLRLLKAAEWGAE